MNICILTDCNVKSKARGLCQSHYYKHKRAGTLDTVALPLKQNASDPHSLSDIDPENKTATCVFCGPLTKIYIAQSGNWACRSPKDSANKRYAKGRGYILNHSSYFYGDGDRIPAAKARTARDELIVTQNNLCAICKKEPVTMQLALDHCHTTGEIRGLLCGNCNRGLGYFQDSPELLSAALDYLKPTA